MDNNNYYDVIDYFHNRYYLNNCNDDILKDLFNSNLKYIDDKLSNNIIYKKSKLEYNIKKAFSDIKNNKTIQAECIIIHDIKPILHEFSMLDYLIENHIYDYGVLYNTLYNISVSGVRNDYYLVKRYKKNTISGDKLIADMLNKGNSIIRGNLCFWINAIYNLNVVSANKRRLFIMSYKN